MGMPAASRTVAAAALADTSTRIPTFHSGRGHGA